MEKNFAEKFERPWGYYENLLEEKGYKVKRLVVNPDQQLSLQYHFHRAEYWTCVEGSGYVTIGEGCYHATPHSHYKIDARQQHRLKGGENGITIIEVQLGSQCNEEDIVRLKDDYKRV
jgi:mannose-6-phosphate isomerase-like protein (cupin superfamily)